VPSNSTLEDGARPRSYRNGCRQLIDFYFRVNWRRSAVIAASVC